MTAFAEFTTPDGKPVYLAVSWVIKVMAALPAEKGATRIDHSGGVQFVKEAVGEVIQALHAASD